MKINGGCHCGAIKYEAELEPESVGICHCMDCQQLSASAFRTVGVVQPGMLKLTKGEPKTYVKIGDSGNPREQAFCGNCGTGIYATSPGDGPKTHNLRMGTVEQRAEFAPHFQVWCKSALPWIPDIETAMKMEEQ